ncbi:MAG: TonB-dependent receptor, partial [Pseudomonadota bacterium]
WNIGTQFTAYATGEDNFDSDGFQTKIYGSFSGAVSDRLSVYGYASYDDQGGIYRAEGDLLTGRSQFVDDITLFGKARLELTDDQAVTLTLNSTELDYQDRSFELARTDAGDGTIVASEVAFPFSYGSPPTNEFFYGSLDYTHDDFLGGRLSTQLYYSESEFLNPGSDIRALLNRFGGPFPDIFPGLWQTGQEVEEFGFRGQFTRSFDNGWNIATGVDYNDADSDSLLPISTEDGFDETGFFDGATQAIQRPPYTLDAIGLFVEAGYSVTDRLSLSGGIRWDEFDYEVIGPYDVVFAFQFPRGERPGGSGTADDFSYNVGLNYDLTERTVLFANYSEGFTIPSLGFVGNNVPPGVPVSDSALVEPVITDSVEVGLRGSVGDFVYAAAAYYTESNFEATVGIDPATGLALRNRAPVEIYGLEASGTWFVTDRFSVGGSLTWVEGEIDPNDDGNQIDLSTQVVPPVKVTLEPRYQISRKWDVFGQLFYSGDRDEGFDAGTDANPAESYTLVDVGTDYRINDSMRFGAQITNLFNEEYIPPGEATFIPGRIFSGPGRAVTLTFDVVF